MTKYERFVANVKLRRWVVLLSLVIVLWLVRSVMSTILLTFIFSYHSAIYSYYLSCYVCR